MEEVLKAFESYINTLVDKAIGNKVAEAIDNYDFTDDVERVTDRINFVTEDNLCDSVREVIDSMNFEVRVR